MGRHRINSCTFLLALLCAAGFSRAQQPPAQPPSTQPAGTISGSIISPGEVPLSQMVVYLAPDDDQPITPPSNVVQISQKGARFSPPLVVICVGQTVSFDNDEERQIDHNVFSNSSAKQFDLGSFNPGEDRTVTFDKPGPVILYCSIHRNMDGAIYVAPTPYFSLVDDAGHYRIDNVPAGHWVVWTWQRQRRFKEAKAGVKVTQGQTITQDLTLTKK